MVVLALMLGAGTAEASASTSAVTVTARVVPHVKSQLDAEPSSVVVTEQDISRGFVDADAGVLSTQTNDPAGYLVTFMLRGTAFHSAKIEGLTNEVVVAAGGGFAHERFSGTAMSSRVLRCRLNLTASTSPGRYAWPVQISVLQLDARVR